MAAYSSSDLALSHSNDHPSIIVNHSFPSADDPLLPEPDADAAAAADIPNDRPKGPRPTPIVALLLATGLLGIIILATSNTNNMVRKDKVCQSLEKTGTVDPGLAAGVSPKTFRPPFQGGPPFPWTTEMLDWQRTAFHFQPQKNWMNDPNGPVLYKGWYHFFYQYNPFGAIWGNIVWGHAVSKDLIHWRHLPIAMAPDHWYDINGVWTGSATILDDGELIMLYTGSTNESVQVQNLAYPANSSDPMLVEWVKYPGNPVLVPPPGIDSKDFRDPTTAWATPEGKWRLIIGSKINETGIALVYDTKDFKSYEMLDDLLHAVPDTGMWECVDFYPVSTMKEHGLDTSDNGLDVKHVVKTSLDDDRNDYYTIGTYDNHAGTWKPDDPIIDVGIGLRYDYGTFYASKTFYDQEKRRRILWGWIQEKDSESSDVKKGWSSLQAIPRTVLFDKKTKSNLLQWPVEEVNRLRHSLKVFNKVEAKPGSVVPLDVGPASELDIMVEYEIDKEDLKKVNNDPDHEVYNCSTSRGASQRGALGPFGLLVLSDKDQSEQTPVYFYIYKDKDGYFKTSFCADHSRSSEAHDVDKSIYGTSVTVTKDEKLSMRIIIDHSIVESFAQGGRACITSRIYPTKAVYGNSRVLLFNNATDAKITASVKIWQMNPYASYAHMYSVSIVSYLLPFLLFFIVGSN